MESTMQPKATAIEGAAASNDPALAHADIGLDQTTFFKTMLRELSGTIEEVVGVERASGYIATVGSAVADWLNAAYHAELGQSEFDVQRLAHVFVDLKDRIDGGFYIKSITADEITLGNSRCPFGDAVLGRPSLCMMTSNVFGRIAAENQGYARVRLDRTIAQGHGECDVVVSLRAESDRQPHEREYYRTAHLEIG